MVDVPWPGTCSRRSICRGPRCCWSGTTTSFRRWDPGNILRDLIPDTRHPTVILDKVVRQAGVLGENCTAVLKGRGAQDQRGVGGRMPGLVSGGSVHRSDGGTLVSCWSCFRSGSTPWGLTSSRTCRCRRRPTRDRSAPKELNEELQRLIQRKLWNTEVPPVAMGRRAPFLKARQRSSRPGTTTT